MTASPTWTRHSALPFLMILAACATTPQGKPSSSVATSAAPVIEAPAEPPATLKPAPPSNEPLAMHHVMDVFSLVDLKSANGSVELRLGAEGSGLGSANRGVCRLVPLEGSTVVWSKETMPIPCQPVPSLLYRQRPNLVFYRVAGAMAGAFSFQEYHVMGPLHDWLGSAAVATLNDTDGGLLWSYGVGPWSNHGLLEVRAAPPGISQLALPEFRLIGNTTGAAVPTIPAALKKTLETKGFRVLQWASFANGSAVVIGNEWLTEGAGSIVWADDLANPKYIPLTLPPAKTAEAQEKLQEQIAALKVLGGTDLVNTRIQFGNDVLRYHQNSWQVAQSLSAGQMPDVWFGMPMLQWEPDEHALVRLAKNSPWQKVDGHHGATSIVVDKDGTVWMNKGQSLFSSRAPAKGTVTSIDEATLRESRKLSILRGGSFKDTLAANDGSTMMTGRSLECRAHFVVLHRAKQGEDVTAAYAQIGRKLRGHPEFSKVAFVIVQERGVQFLGAQSRTKTTDGNGDAVLQSLATIAGSDTPAQQPLQLCAEPAAHKKVRVDLTNGTLSY